MTKLMCPVLFESRETEAAEIAAEVTEREVVNVQTLTVSFHKLQ